MKKILFASSLALLLSADLYAYPDGVGASGLVIYVPAGTSGNGFTNNNYASGFFTVGSYIDVHSNPNDPTDISRFIGQVQIDSTPTITLYSSSGTTFYSYRYQGIYNGNSGCPSGSTLTGNVCVFPTLSDYDNDPEGCDHAGGYYYSSGIVQSGGTNYTIPLLFGASLTLKSNYAMVTHCGTFSDVAGQVASNVLSMLPATVAFFRSSSLAKLARFAFSNYLQGKLAYTPPPTAKNDYFVDLPKLPPPGSNSMKVVVPVTESPIPTATNISGIIGPSRSPEVNVAPNYANIDDSYIPQTSNGDPIVDYSVVDRFNSLNYAITSNTPITDIVPQLGISSTSVKETFDLSQTVSGTPSPNTVGIVTATTTKDVTFSGSDPIDTYTTTKSYPDGSSSSQVVKINRATKQGYISSTTLANTGESSTLNVSIYVPTYSGVLQPTDIIKAPPSQSFATTSTPPNTVNTVSPSASVPAVANTMNNPDQISGQDATTIINAKMPNYSFPLQSDITNFVTDPINALNAEFTDLFDNLNNQFTTVQNTFNTTKDLISGGWTPPVIPPGACGDFMSFDFHGQHVDLCPPLAQQTAKISPLITLLITIAGSILAVRIYINALRD